MKKLTARNDREDGLAVCGIGNFLYGDGGKGDNYFYSGHEGYDDIGFMERGDLP